MNDTKNKLLKLSKNSKLFGFGSPTKIVLFLKLLKLPQKKIECIFEDNKLKINKFLPVSGYKILCSSNIKLLKPKYLIIFAWNFQKDIIHNLKKVNSRIKFVTLLPKFNIV